MQILYVSFHTDVDPGAFDAWLRPIVERTRQRDGCLVYDHLLDPDDPTRHWIVEVFKTAEAMAAHTSDPLHIEVMALGSLVYGMRDLTVQHWTDARGHDTTTLPRTDQSRPGREHLDPLIAARQRAHREATGPPPQRSRQ